MAGEPEGGAKASLRRLEGTIGGSSPPRSPEPSPRVPNGVAGPLDRLEDREGQWSDVDMDGPPVPGPYAFAATGEAPGSPSPRHGGFLPCGINGEISAFRPLRPSPPQSSAGAKRKWGGPDAPSPRPSPSPPLTFPFPLGQEEARECALWGAQESSGEGSTGSESPSELASEDRGAWGEYLGEEGDREWYGVGGRSHLQLAPAHAEQSPAVADEIRAIAAALGDLAAVLAHPRGVQGDVIYSTKRFSYLLELDRYMGMEYYGAFLDSYNGAQRYLADLSIRRHQEMYADSDYHRFLHEV